VLFDHFAAVRLIDPIVTEAVAIARHASASHAPEFNRPKRDRDGFLNPSFAATSRAVLIGHSVSGVRKGVRLVLVPQFLLGLIIELLVLAIGLAGLLPKLVGEGHGLRVCWVCHGRFTSTRQQLDSFHFLTISVGQFHILR
jgi:hypothetical protein